MRPTEAHPGESSPLTNIRTVPQKRSHHQIARRTTGRNAPTSFFMRTEDELDQMASTSSRTQADSTFGVQSLSSTVDSCASIAQDGDNSLLEPRIWERRDSDYEFSPPHPLLGPTILSPTPLTPLYLRSPVAGSGIDSGAPSTPKSLSFRSLRLSDEESGAEDSADQAIASSGEEDNDVEEKVDMFTPPQLVMPSISMPSRRPFTERGKKVGKLKILVAGPKGSGKTSLISSIIQTSDDIVHVDSASTSSMTLSNYDGRSSHRSSLTVATNTRQISEINASTRAYPPWWSELDESRVLRRRKSTNETVLERNVCFVDTPGICDDVSSQSQMNSVLEYIESLLWRSQSLATFSDGEILGMLSGNGGVYVDLIVFVLSGHPRPVDLEYMRRLSRTTNVMPIFSKADLLSAAEQSALKTHLLETLQTEELRPFLFGNTVTDLLNYAQQDGMSLPYAVSSASAPDHEIMDASLLMSSNYIQPLQQSDLTTLTSRLFDPDTTAHLRHSSARKFLQWRRTTTAATALSLTRTLPIPTLHAPTPMSRTATATATVTAPSNSTILPPPPRPAFPPRASTTTTLTPSPFHLARLADHADREERLSQVHLARWAADLQRSLQNERERYAALQREERRAWLAERMSECVDEEIAAAGLREYGGEVDAIGAVAGAFAGMEGRGTGRSSEWGAAKGTGAVGGAGSSGTASAMSARDPLGLLEWDERVRRRGFAIVKVLGGCGVVGALAVWVLRNWDVTAWWGPGSGSGYGFGSGFGPWGPGGGFGGGGGTGGFGGGFGPWGGSGSGCWWVDWGFPWGGWGWWGGE